MERFLNQLNDVERRILGNALAEYLADSLKHAEQEWGYVEASETYDLIKRIGILDEVEDRYGALGSQLEEATAERESRTETLAS